jgi:hypothetical protein
VIGVAVLVLVVGFAAVVISTLVSEQSEPVLVYDLWLLFESSVASVARSSRDSFSECACVYDGYKYSAWLG